MHSQHNAAAAATHSLDRRWCCQGVLWTAVSHAAVLHLLLMSLPVMSCVSRCRVPACAAAVLQDAAAVALNASFINRMEALEMLFLNRNRCAAQPCQSLGTGRDGRVHEGA
jgi:hypothetical protein